MSALDVVAIPGYPGKWARRAVVEAWIEADCPPLNWAGRTYEEQLDLALHGPNAADDPRVSWTRVPHVRGLALDLKRWTPAIVKRMHEAGFVRPITVLKGTPWADGEGGFSQDEPWHFELKQYVNKVFDIPKVKDSQTAGLDHRPFDPEEDDDMPLSKDDIKKVTDAVVAAVWGTQIKYGTGPKSALQALADVPKSVWAFPVHRSSGNVQAIQELADAKTGTLLMQAQLTAVLQLLDVQSETGQPVSLDAVRAAAEEGARRALAGLTLTARIE